MTETALRRSGPGELRLGAVSIAAAAGAWALTAARMGGMDAGPGADLGGLECAGHAGTRQVASS